MTFQYLGWLFDICIAAKGAAPFAAQTKRYRRQARPSDRMRSIFSALLIKRLISDIEPIKSRSRCDGEHFVERRAEGVW